MKKIILIGMMALVGVAGAGCRRTPVEFFQLICGEATPSSFKVTKSLQSTSPYRAVFARVSKDDFASFKQASTEFTAWRPRNGNNGI